MGGPEMIKIKSKDSYEYSKMIERNVAASIHNL